MLGRIHLTRHLLLDAEGIVWVRDDVEEPELVAGERLGPVLEAMPPAGLWAELDDLVDQWRQRVSIDELHAEALAGFNATRGPC